jgi:type II secretory ATPase GspE/PulE/Tfp pilus assembly ATPase PilB-like protein
VITELDLQRAASDLIGRDYAFQNDILPLAFQDGVLILGVEPEKATIDEKAALRVRFKQLVELRSMAIESIRAGLHELYEAPRSAPAAGTVEALFYDLFAASLAARAHDLIIEPIEYGRDNQVHAVVRHHVDGVHRDASMLSPEDYQQISRFVRERFHLRSQQDRAVDRGNGTYRIDERLLDVRVSMLPMAIGPRFSIRVQQRMEHIPTPEGLGMRGRPLEVAKRATKRRNRMTLLVGPSRSGKNWTIMSLLVAYFNFIELAVASCEDPIEVWVKRMIQVEVDRQNGITPERVLEEWNRQGIKVGYTGEIQTAATAQFSAFLTKAGVQTFGSAHAPTAPRAFALLQAFGLSSSDITDSIGTIISQRLVKLLCGDCKVPADVPELITARFPNLLAEVGNEPTVYAPRPDDDLRARCNNSDCPSCNGGSGTWCGKTPCELCSGWGYLGEIGVFEALEIDDAIRQAILESPHGTSEYVIRPLAIAQGWRSYYEDALLRVLEGKCSMAHVEADLGSVD